MGVKIARYSEGNSTLEPLASASFQIAIEGNSYPERQSPYRGLLDKMPKILSKGDDCSVIKNLITILINGPNQRRSGCPDVRE